MSKGISFFEIGVLYAVREIAINIFEIPSGIISDAMGRRKTLASSLVDAHTMSKNIERFEWIEY